MSNKEQRELLALAHALMFGNARASFGRVYKASLDALRKITNHREIDTNKENYNLWVQHMKQQWVIDGEWSAYHAMVAASKGWSLTQRQGMWEITTSNEELFKTDDDARKHVLEAELNPEHDEFNIALIAINAIMVGNVRG